MAKLIVITGPSGVGKGTIVASLLEAHPELYLSISATTRTPRDGEINGEHYCFHSVREFEEMIEKGELLEWAEYAGNYYGTPRTKVLEQLQQNKSVILEIEVTGARQIKQTLPQAFRIFILPPSLDELERRLRDRGKDSEVVIQRRLQKAREEIAACSEFDRQIVNDDLSKTVKEITAVIFSQAREQVLALTN